jgi:TRAP transporter TAXI family solute receptor
MKNGSVDAMVLPGLVDPDQMTLAVIRDGAYLLPIEGPPIDDLRRDAPFVRTILIPRGIYPGQDRIVATVGIDLVIVCSADLDEALVYQLTQQLFNVFPRISRSEATLRFLNVEEAPATPIPLHPGAARYFRERELSR